MKDIRSVADILRIAIPEEYSKIDSMHIPHMGNLGAAYEGVVQYISEIICADIGHGFSVVSGQIAVDDFVIPGQIDRMIVHGEGKEIGIRSGIYQYDISQVIAVIESKKTLNKSSLHESITQLGRIREQGFFRKDYYTRFGVERSTSAISSYMMERNDFFTWSDTDRTMLLQSFINDRYLPLSIVFGHNGYKSPKTLGQTYHDLVFKEKMKYANHWFLPTLIISGSDVIAKGGDYPVLMSSKVDRSIMHSLFPGRAFEILAYAIWKKINIDRIASFDVADYYENIAQKMPLVGFCFRSVQDNKGWQDPLTICLSYRSSFK